jgi:hydrogenase maturation protein HypF
MIDARSLAEAVSEHAAGSGYVMPIHSCEGQRLHQLDARALWAPLLEDLLRDEPLQRVAARFHVAFAAGLAQLCAEVADDAKHSGEELERELALSGGCMQNAVLHERLQAELEALGFAVLTHGDVPANDGGIAFGQALVVLSQQA